MNKGIIVGEFRDEYGAVLVGGRKNIDQMKKRGFPIFVREQRRTVNVPGVILGTPEEWDREFHQGLVEAVQG